ncbi:MAG: hypothetical protein Q9164_007454, partial [Protoblastenia rupestris]
LHQLQTSGYVRASIALDIARRYISKHCSHECVDRDDRSRIRHEHERPDLEVTVDERLNDKLTLWIAILGETLQLKRPKIPSGLNGREQLHNEPNIQEKN